MSTGRKLTSQYIGVSWKSREGKWRAQINIGGKHRELGFFAREEDASNAYQDALKKSGRQEALNDMDQILANIQISESGCWLWQGGQDGDGYARKRLNGHYHRLHRWMYQHYKGSIPNNLVLDHLCRVRHCINPDHLEVVTRGENVLRGDTITAHEKARTHCPHGHPYNEENTLMKNGSRNCRACIRIYDKKRRSRKILPN